MGRARKSCGGSGASTGGEVRKRGRPSKKETNRKSGEEVKVKVESADVGEVAQVEMDEVLPRRDESSGGVVGGSGSRSTRSGMIDKLESFLDSSLTGEDPVEESMSGDDSLVPEVAALRQPRRRSARIREDTTMEELRSGGDSPVTSTPVPEVAPPQPSRQSARIRERGGRQSRKFYSPSPPSSKKRGAGGGNNQGRRGRKSSGIKRKNSECGDEKEDSLLRNIKLEIPDDRNSEGEKEELDFSFPEPNHGGQGSRQKVAVGKNKATPRRRNKVKLESVKTEVESEVDESEFEMAQCPPPHPSKRRIQKSERKMSDSKACDSKGKIEESCVPPPPKKRGRGRPLKSDKNEGGASSAPTPAPEVPIPKRRGRPPKQKKNELTETPDAPEPTRDCRELAVVSKIESGGSSQETKEPSPEPSTSKKRTGQPRILLDQPLPPGKVVTIERSSTIKLENGHPVSEIYAKVVNVQDPSETPNAYAASSGAPAGGPVVHEKYYVVDPKKDECVLKNPLGIMVKQCIFANHALRTSVVPQIARKIKADAQASKVLSKALKSEQEKQSKLMNSHEILCKVQSAKDKICVEEKVKAEEAWREIDKTKLYNFTMQEGEVQRYFIKHKFEEAEAEIREEAEKKINEIQAEICDLTKEHEMLLKKVENAERNLLAEDQRTERFKDIAGTLLGFVRRANPQVPLPDVEQDVAEELMEAADENEALSSELFHAIGEKLLAAVMSEGESEEEEEDFELVE